MKHETVARAQSNPDVSSSSWTHVHLCPTCGDVTAGESIPHASLATGIIMCERCGHEGPINLQIAKASDAS